MLNILEDVTVTDVVAHLGKLIESSDVKSTKLCTTKKKGIDRPMNYLYLHRSLRAYTFDLCIIIIGDTKIQSQSWAKHIIISHSFKTDCFGTRR